MDTIETTFEILKQEYTITYNRVPVGKIIQATRTNTYYAFIGTGEQIGTFRSFKKAKAAIIRDYMDLIGSEE